MKLLNPAVPPQTVHAGRLKALVLDWAGTTVDFGSLAPARTMQRLFAKLDITLTEQETRQHMGLPKKEHIRGILSIPRIREAWTALRGDVPGDADVDEMYAEFIPMQFSCLEEYSAVIPGVAEAVDSFRGRGLKIGSTTGYTRAMLDLLLETSAHQGYRPDCSLTPEEAGAGRPHPFMMYESAVRLQVYPLAAIAKIGDTPADIREGLNAGAWSIGVAGTGNSIGLSVNEFHALPESDRESLLTQARAELENAGAHYVIDTMADAHAVLDEIDAQLRATSASPVRANE
ncbi:MAG: phosphonoacetaldehyde hydrolase [Terracidiphilus sp.]